MRLHIGYLGNPVISAHKSAWRQARESVIRISYWLLAAGAILFAPMLWAQSCAPSNEFSSSRASVVSGPEYSPTPDEAYASTDATASTATANAPSEGDWVNRWLRTVDKARAEQPHTVAPLVTTHVLLVQQFRFDSLHQESPAETWTHGGGKGLEIIPNTRMEVQVGIPPYIVHKTTNVPDGFGDISIFLKFRAFSAPEGKGNYFLGFFLGGSFPSATPPNGLGHTVWSPMIAAAKGWGFFDVQSTLSASLPQSGTNVLGRQILFNNAFQFKMAKIFWPQIETNSTFFIDGPYSGKKQTFLTPGLVVGSFRIFQRLRFAPGVGMQIATTSFHLYDHRWIWSLRFPF
jgi:hypothetical protein